MVTESLPGAGTEAATPPPPASAESALAAASAVANATTGADPEPSPDASPEVQAAVEAWRAAWSGKDATAYLAAYADDFVPPGGLSLDGWQTQRRERLATARKISVQIQRLEVRAEGDTATARFLQHYRSGALDEKVLKRLTLRRTPGGWKIAQEVVETPPPR